MSIQVQFKPIQTVISPQKFANRPLLSHYTTNPLCIMADWIFTEAELRNSPSHRDGMKFKDELILRRKACDFIEKMAKALDLPKLAQISADNYLHRFYMRHSFVRYDKYTVGAACVLLASKVEEVPKKIGYVTREYIAVRKDIEKDQVFAIQKHDPQQIASKIISMEGALLQALAYELTITHPYVFVNERVDRVVRLLQLSDDEAKRRSTKIKQVAWSFLNDSAYTLACLRLESQDLAAGAVYLAGLYENNVPEELCTAEGAPWWEVLSTPFLTLQDAATCLLAAYTDPYLDTQVLPSGLAKLVYMFHPPRSVESPNHPAALLDASSVDSSRPSTASPLDSSMCVTSPECGGSQGRSPFDHDFDHEEKECLSGDKSPLIMADPKSRGMTSVYSRKRSMESNELSRRVRAFR
ncbi:hypothetical protein Poli38472_010739 [Pythium oligandrum]|uniref:Cyclin-like domain-containing protein n=1 Tax=Pythium oligandrum TaxID=41045 RepID=A0A8K1CF36_PYTOL|nr:hypothetical protein Poli38472_010739 [Pythium oligandrum]|eukprot:TMW61676.1 hypothetical protein Poli38472_010739 [Pythium oligandrum]